MWRMGEPRGRRKGEGREGNVRFLHLELLHLDQVLSNLGDTLFTFVDQVIGPVDQVGINLHVNKHVRISLAKLACTPKRQSEGESALRTCSRALE